MNSHRADQPNFDYDPGYAQTYDTDYDHEYDRVTARDIADLLHHLAEMRCAAPTDAIDPTERAAFLTARQSCSPGSLETPNRPASTTAAAKSARWPPTPAPPPHRPSRNFRPSNGWGQIREEHPLGRSPGMGPDHRRTPGPVLVDRASVLDV